jgi:hypothetical protein
MKQQQQQQEQQVLLFICGNLLHILCRPSPGKYCIDKKDNKIGAHLVYLLLVHVLHVR